MNAEQKRIAGLAADLTKQLSMIPDGAHSATIPREVLLMMALVCSYVEKTSGAPAPDVDPLAEVGSGLRIRILVNGIRKNLEGLEDELTR